MIFQCGFGHKLQSTACTTDRRCTRTHKELIYRTPEKHIYAITINRVKPEVMRPAIQNQADRRRQKHTYILERVHDGRLGDMDAVVLVGIGLAPSIQHDDGHRLPLGELRVVGQRPRDPRARHRQRLDLPTKSASHKAPGQTTKQIHIKFPHTDLQLDSDLSDRLISTNHTTSAVNLMYKSGLNNRIKADLDGSKVAACEWRRIGDDSYLVLLPQEINLTRRRE